MDVWIDSMRVKYPLEITQNNAPLLNEVNWRPEKEKHVVMAVFLLFTWRRFGGYFFDVVFGAASGGVWPL